MEFGDTGCADHEHSPPHQRTHAAEHYAKLIDRNGRYRRFRHANSLSKRKPTVLNLMPPRNLPLSNNRHFPPSSSTPSLPGGCSGRPSRSDIMNDNVLYHSLKTSREGQPNPPKVLSVGNAATQSNRSLWLPVTWYHTGRALLVPLLEFNPLAVCLRAVNIDSAVEGPEVRGPRRDHPRTQNDQVWSRLFDHVCQTGRDSINDYRFWNADGICRGVHKSRRQVLDC